MGAPFAAIPQHPFSVPSRGRLTGKTVSTQMLANVLSEQLGRSVHDHTGLHGYFDFTLQWTPDNETAADGQAGPSIFTAVREQLGLRLESSKGPVEVIVIDHIDRTPAQN